MMFLMMYLESPPKYPRSSIQQFRVQKDVNRQLPTSETPLGAVVCGRY